MSVWLSMHVVILLLDMCILLAVLSCTDVIIFTSVQCRISLMVMSATATWVSWGPSAMLTLMTVQ